MDLGLDFGTTHTVVAYADQGNYPVVTFLDENDDAQDHFHRRSGRRWRPGLRLRGAGGGASRHAVRALVQAPARPAARDTRHRAEHRRPGRAAAGGAHWLLPSAAGGAPHRVKPRGTARRDRRRKDRAGCQPRRTAPNASSRSRPAAARGSRWSAWSTSPRQPVSSSPTAKPGRSRPGATSSSSMTSAAAPSTPRCSGSTGPATRCSTPSASTGWAATTSTRSWPRQPCGPVAERGGCPTDRGRRCLRSAAPPEGLSPQSRRVSVEVPAAAGAESRVVTIGIEDFYAAATSLVDATTDGAPRAVLRANEEGTELEGSPGSTSSAGPAPFRLFPACCGRVSAVECTALRCRARRPRSDWPSRQTAAPGSLARPALARLRRLRAGGRGRGVLRPRPRPVPADRRRRGYAVLRRPVVVTRRYRAAHNIGWFRFVEYSSVDDQGEPRGPRTGGRDRLPVRPGTAARPPRPGGGAGFAEPARHTHRAARVRPHRRGAVHGRSGRDHRGVTHRPHHRLQAGARPPG